MPISARSSLSGEYASGTNSGSITLAMNSTVISGTPRTNSMKITENSFTAGMCERRPSASRMPIGSENTMPTHDTTIVTRTPPHSDVSTRRSPIGVQAVEQHVGDDRHDDEEIERAEIAPRRFEPQQPEDADREHREEDIDAPALRDRVRAVDEVGEAVAHERPAGADLGHASALGRQASRSAAAPDRMR